MAASEVVGAMRPDVENMCSIIWLSDVESTRRNVSKWYGLN